MEALLRQRIAERKQQGLYRQRRALSACSKLHVFCHNDYLGMAKHPAVITAFKQAADRYGVGSTASQLVAGYQDIHRELEQAFADFLQRDDALLFSSGYLANCGVIHALATKNDLLLLDKYAHASLIDAASLSAATMRRFPHRRYDMLEDMLVDSRAATTFVVTDSVFSMQGDVADLSRCAALARQYRAAFVVDDAHGIGVLGENGRGALEQAHLSQRDVPVLICPLAKAFGVMGAIVAGSRVLIDYLLQFARSCIYTHAIPPALAAAGLKSLQLVRQESWRREQLNALIVYFKKRARELELPLLPSDTPIQTVVVGDPLLAQQISAALLKQGMLLSAIRPPSVPVHQSCLRVSLSCLHQQKHIDTLLVNIKQHYAHLSPNFV